MKQSKALRLGFVTTLLMVLNLPMNAASSADLWAAASTGDIGALEAHRERGANVNALDSMGVSALHGAVAANQRETVEWLLQNGARVNARSRSGRTPFATAAFLGNVEMAQLLFKNGANIRIPDDRGLTTLKILSLDWETSRSIATDGLQQIIDQRALEAGRKKIALWLAEADYWIAIRIGDISALTTHLESGVDANDQGPRNGEIPLQMAAVYGHTDAVRLLLEHGADVNAQGRDGSTALHSAALFEHEGVVRVLLENGATADLKDARGATALGNANLDRTAKEYLARSFQVELKKNEIEARHNEVINLLKTSPR